MTCPRCHAPLPADDLYGPCAGCRAELRSLFDGAARTVESAAYEPKMNVTPNAVALKE